ncbi:hypothetical protein QW180_23175 [Vibrio sinaloensis]|nr:hypothetical protein [Vibrio sinaloensis]
MATWARVVQRKKKNTWDRFATFFVAGTYNKFDADEVTELPNSADMSAIEIFIDGRRFHLETGEVSNYSRRLNVKKNGELIREFTWTNNEGKSFEMRFRRFFSQANLHLMAFDVQVKALNSDAKIEIRSGVDAQLSNSGAQHFHEGEKAYLRQAFLSSCYNTQPRAKLISYF